MAIINGIRVSGYTRRRPKADRIDPIWLEFVGNVLSAELAERLSEPLDEIDMSDEQKQRIRETM